MNIETVFLPVIMIYRIGRVVKWLPCEFSKSVKKMDNGNLLFPDGGNPYFKIEGILDRRGNWISLIEIKKHVSFMQWFSPVWDFVKSEYEVHSCEKLTVEKLLEHTKYCKNSGGRMLRKFLVKQDKEAIFDEVIFRKAWEHSYIKLPEEEWHREFKLK